MSTKPPSTVQEFPTDSIEKMAYSITEEIPTLEPNDRVRLGYCLWAWLNERRGSLKQAIHAAGVRSVLTEQEIFEKVSKKLKEKGIVIS